jgi:hypothetical protein
MESGPGRRPRIEELVKFSVHAVVTSTRMATALSSSTRSSVGRSDFRSSSMGDAVRFHSSLMTFRLQGRSNTPCPGIVIGPTTSSIMAGDVEACTLIPPAISSAPATVSALSTQPAAWGDAKTDLAQLAEGAEGEGPPNHRMHRAGKGVTIYARPGAGRRKPTIKSRSCTR